MRRAAIASLSAAALVAAAFAAPGIAAQQFTTFQVTVSGAGDPDGTGSAALEFNLKRESLCYRIHTENVTTPITGGAIVDDATGEVALADIIVIDRGTDLEECVGFLGQNAHQAMRRIGKDPSRYSLELYNDEHPSPPGALRGTLEGVS